MKPYRSPQVFQTLLDQTSSTHGMVSGSGRPASPQFRVRPVARREVTSEFLIRWRDLERRSCHTNVFLSPDFLVPAWNCLEPNGTSFLLIVEEQSGGRLLALGCFQESPGSWTLPLPHLVAAKTMHTFRTGLLLDEQYGERALVAWLDYVRRQPQWGGVVFPNLRLDSILAQRLQAATSAAELPWHTSAEYPSAAMFPPVWSADDPTAHLSSHRRKGLRRRLRQLENIGPVQLRRIERPADLALAVERFLVLEDLGWKGAEGTSLRADNRAVEFLRAMAAGMFEQGRLVLTELLAGDRVVATSVNLLGATTLYAFKIGWDTQFAKASPGVLHQHLMLPMVCRELPDVTCLDSCARPGSFLEDLWPHRINIGEAVLPTTRLARSTVAALSSARRLKSLWHSSLTPIPPNP